MPSNVISSTLSINRLCSMKGKSSLPIRSITTPVLLDVEFGGILKDPWGNDKAGFTLTGRVNRKDWGRTWNVPLEAGGLLVSEEIRINCELQLMRQA